MRSRPPRLPRFTVGRCRGSAVGAAPLASAMTHTPKEWRNVSNSAPLLPQPDSHVIGRGTNWSNKINPTEPTNQLTWTALTKKAPLRPRSTAVVENNEKLPAPSRGYLGQEDFLPKEKTEGK